MLCHVETDILTNESISQEKHIYLQMTKRLKIRDSQEILCNVFVHPPTSIHRMFQKPDDYGLGMQTRTQKKASANQRMPEKPLPG